MYVIKKKTITRLLKRIIIIGSFIVTTPTYSQSNADSLIFINLISVYKSNFIDFSSSELLVLKFKAIPKDFTYDGIFCKLSNGIFKSSTSINDNDIVDSLSKMFFIYKVEFEKSKSGQKADSILTTSNYYAGYLVPLKKDQGVVTHYILKRWTWKFNFVQYKTTNLDCNDSNQCCVVRIASMK